MLVVLAIISVLAALLLPALARAKGSAARTRCLGNVKQLNLAINLYTLDNDGSFPATTTATWNAAEPNHFAIFYKRFVRQYLVSPMVDPRQDRVFHCPADTFYHDFPNMDVRSEPFYAQSFTEFSSYGFNGSAENMPAPPRFLNEDSFGGLSGLKLSAVANPAKTFQVGDFALLAPWSWHKPVRVPAGQVGVPDAPNNFGFVDGHASYLKVYWNTNYPRLTACCYEPPPSYGYKWHAE